MEWYRPVDYNFDIASDSSHEEWIALQDFPTLEQIIPINDNQGEQWMHLSLDSSLKKVISSTQYPYRNLKTFIKTAFVPCSDIVHIKNQLSNTRFFPNFNIPQDYKLLMAEYPNTLSCKQRFKSGNISLEDELPGTENAQCTTINLLRGNEWEYDCSQNEYVPNLNVPVPDLVNFYNLTWNGLSSWVDESKTVQIIEIHTESSTGVLIKHNYIRNFLQTSSLALVLIGYQEKLLITGHSRSSSIHELRTVHIFDGQNIIKAYNFSEIL